MSNKRNPEYHAAVALLDEADKSRKKAGLPKFTKDERAIAITYFCEGVRHQKRSKGEPVDDQPQGDPPGSWMLEPDSPH